MRCVVSDVLVALQGMTGMSLCILSTLLLCCLAAGWKSVTSSRALGGLYSRSRPEFLSIDKEGQEKSHSDKQLFAQLATFRLLVSSLQAINKCRFLAGTRRVYCHTCKVD
jgi:hypothetical protein